MKVLFISPNSPFESIGGVERHISNLIDYCGKSQKSDSFIMLPTSESSHISIDRGVKIYFEKCLQIDKNSSPKQIFDKSQEFTQKIEELITKHKIDIIVAENFHVGLPASFSLVLNMKAGIYNIPLVLRLHSFASTDLQVELVNQLMWKKISCVSKSVTGDCFQKGADINTLSTDYLGVDMDKFSKKSTPKLNLRQTLGMNPDDKIIMSASRILHGRKNIIKEKGLINLIQAFSKISPRYSNLKLLLAVGKPPDNLAEEFEQSLNMLRGYLILNNVDDKTVIKMFKLDEMADVYQQSDIFALPSENETFGQVFIESMSCGTPVIGTKTGGIPEIISDRLNGYLIPPNDSSVLAQSIEELLNDNISREKYIEASINTVKQKFNSIDQFTNFYKFLANILYN